MGTTAVATERPRTLALPPRARPMGPVTARLARRTFVIFGVPMITAIALLLATESPRLHALAHGLLFPGGGFLYSSDPTFFAVAFVVFIVAFVAWFIIGMMFAPFLVWWAAAVLAAIRTPSTVWTGVDIGLPAGLGAVILLSFVTQRASFRRSQRRADVLNTKLATIEYRPPTGPTSREILEHSEVDLAHHRYLLNLALQPVDRFDGFEWVDQFREAAVRYQLNYGGWGLALGQYTRTPAFTGYVAEAQRRLIEKMSDRRVWQYWKWENLWGNFSTDVDPMARDNIMLSGYYGLQIAAYETTNGDHRYDQAACLPFRWNDKKTFAYDHPAVAKAVHHNFSQSTYCMFPCEPNWVYPLCNMIAMGGLIAHDRLHGTGYAEDVRDAFDHAARVEFSTVDGRPLSTRSSRIGITVPGITNSTTNIAGFTFWLSPLVNDIAVRNWVLARDNAFTLDRDGLAVMKFLSPADRLDVGNYKPSIGYLVYAFGIAAAREMGDDEMADGLQRSLDVQGPAASVEGGALRYPGSNAANVMLSPGRFGGRRAWHDLINYGTPEVIARGPVLADAPYPQVLVAMAVTDGSSIDLVLRPGDGAGRQPLLFERLAPSKTYAVVGGVEDRVTADAEGRAAIRIDLDGRKEVRLTPMN
ncbi:MAG: hypothetical protein WEB06_07155 [Actinomycetota bacterium]